MNKPDLVGKILVIPYLLTLFYLPSFSSMVLSIIFFIILLNLDILSREFYKVEVKRLWVIPLSYLIYLALNLLLEDIFTPGIFFFILIFLLMAIYEEGYGSLREYIWLYIVILSTIIVLVALLGMRYYVFYLITPTIDYILIRSLSSLEYMDVFLTDLVSILVYLPITSIFIVYIAGIISLKIVSYLKGLDTYLMFIDYYLRILYGWLIGFGY